MISFGYRPDVEVDGDDIVNVGNESNKVDRYLWSVSCYYRSYYSIIFGGSVSMFKYYYGWYYIYYCVL